ncbi:MAG: hypothetical protein ACLFS9_07015, partial [Nitriliruptoraceae bacterium]
PAGTAAANLLIGGGTAWVLGAQVLFLRLAPRERMAQVTGAMIAGLAVADGVGSLALAALADRAGPAAAYLVGGVAIGLALVLGAWLRARSEVTRALDRADAAG